MSKQIERLMRVSAKWHRAKYNLLNDRNSYVGMPYGTYVKYIDQIRAGSPTQERQRSRLSDSISCILQFVSEVVYLELTTASKTLSKRKLYDFYILVDVIMCGLYKNELTKVEQLLLEFDSEHDNIINAIITRYGRGENRA